MCSMVKMDQQVRSRCTCLCLFTPTSFSPRPFDRSCFGFATTLIVTGQTQQQQQQKQQLLHPQLSQTRIFEGLYSWKSDEPTVLISVVYICCYPSQLKLHAMQPRRIGSAVTFGRNRDLHVVQDMFLCFYKNLIHLLTMIQQWMWVRIPYGFRKHKQSLNDGIPIRWNQIKMFCF